MSRRGTVAFSLVALAALAVPVSLASAAPSKKPPTPPPPTAPPPTAPPGTWAATASMSTPRANLTATRLGNGRVLVVGGEGDTTHASTAELYDPSTGSWIAAGML